MEFLILFFVLLIVLGWFFEETDIGRALGEAIIRKLEEW